MGTPAVIDALTALAAALDAADKGQPHALMSPNARRAGRPTQPLDDRVTQGALLRAMAYLRASAQRPTAQDALRTLSDDLAKQGARIKPAQLSNLIEAESRAAGRSKYHASKAAPKDRGAYERWVAYLALQLPRLLKRRPKRTTK